MWSAPTCASARRRRRGAAAPRLPLASSRKAPASVAASPCSCEYSPTSTSYCSPEVSRAPTLAPSASLAELSMRCAARASGLKRDVAVTPPRRRAPSSPGAEWAGPDDSPPSCCCVAEVAIPPRRLRVEGPALAPRSLRREVPQVAGVALSASSLDSRDMSLAPDPLTAVEVRLRLRPPSSGGAAPLSRRRLPAALPSGAAGSHDASAADSASDVAEPVAAGLSRPLPGARSQSAARAALA